MEIEIIRENLRAMLETRGDDVSYIQEHGDAVESSRYFSEVITLDTDKTTVFFALTKDLQKDWKSNYDTGESLTKEYKGYKQFMLVLVEPPSSLVMTKLTAIDKELSSIGGSLQLFYKKELLYNPLKHSLVPLHEKLSESEGKKIMESYMIKQKLNMPIIYRNDIIARWLGLRPGEIVRITRYNETSGTYYYYRCCV
jgi:DNA-directed RNA polymerase subunit H (RpoH/RPB5)